MTNLLLRFSRLLLGLFLYALGIVITIKADIGYGPWEVFHAGLGKTLGFSIGTASILVGLVIIVITLFLGERVGLGTILNMLLIGVFLDAILALDLIPRVENRYLGALALVVGLYVISLGSFFYIGSGFGAGPRDGLMVSLTRASKWPIGLIRGSIEVSATLIGWLLGGMAGLGTIIAGLAIGFCVQSTFAVLKFDPTTIRHASLVDTAKEVRGLFARR